MRVLRGDLKEGAQSGSLHEVFFGAGHVMTTHGLMSQKSLMQDHIRALNPLILLLQTQVLSLQRR